MTNFSPVIATIHRMSITFDLFEEDFGLERSDDDLPQKWLDLAKFNIRENPDKKLNITFLVNV